MTRAALVLGAWLLWPTAALAQDPVPPLPLPVEPIGPFVLDARAVVPFFKRDPLVAAAIGTEPGNLPNRGLGLSLGGHLYVLRGKSVTVGLGADVLVRARGRFTVGPETEDGPEGPTFITEMTAVTPQLSLNFGRRDGWSYVSGGIGWGTLSIEQEEEPYDASPPRVRTINYGGGARWFARKHLAFNLDFRFHRIAAQEATTGEVQLVPPDEPLLLTGRPAIPATRLIVLSLGISVR
jgi:hypothetical protein